MAQTTFRVKKSKLQDTVGGQVRSIPAYYTGQNTRGVPDHYESPQSAKELKRRGLAHSIHRGTALLLRGVRTSRPDTRESFKKGWKVVGQTPKKNASGPGFPRWASV